MRLFVAIPLAPVVVDELSAFVKRLQSPGDGLRWSRPEGWHITLQFLGETKPQKCDCAVARLRELRMPAVPVWVEELAVFDRAGVFYAGVRLTPELVALQERVTAAIEPCGFAREQRSYQAHITLARSRERTQRDNLHALAKKLPPQTSFSNFMATEFLLYESFLGPGGSRYEVRERFALE